MVSVFFYCSSPYVGYTLKQADYINKEMKSVSEKDMTVKGYKLINSSGSYMVLGKFGGRKYFHTRQSQSENYDEQNRRILTNVAFVGENEKDDEIVNKLAMYIMFNEEKFYQEISGMIALIQTGFTVDFEKLEVFLKKFVSSNITLKSKSNQTSNFFEKIMKCQKELSFVITESTWSYLVKQMGYDFNEDVLYKFSSEEAKNLTDGSTVEFCNTGIQPPPPPPPSDDDEDSETNTVEEPEINGASDHILKEKYKKIEELKQDINNICAERNSLETNIRELQKKISDLLRENETLKSNKKSLVIKSVLAGVIGTVLAVLVILILKWIF